ncbi:MAG: hypothetical protein KJ927_02255, partial [Candidatus Eisenbacteria bacterium]|nr:hypothetical protein [Candidatus Eisenbacteria bacterium]
GAGARIIFAECHAIPCCLHLILAPLLLVLFSLPLAGCSQKETDPTDNTGTGPWVDLLHPTDGFVTADTLSVQSHIVSTYDLDHLTLLIDGVEIATLYMPPWHFFQNDIAVEDSTWVTVEVHAYDIKGGVGVSPQVYILLVPNHAPMTQILFPYQDHFMAVDSVSPRDWLCQAVDPDVDSVPDAWITWSEDGTGPLGNGRILRAPMLDLGPRTIRVEVCDRWGRFARDHRHVTIFRYPLQNQPEDALATFRLAVRARDTAMIGRVLSPNLLWTFCTGEWGAATCRCDDNSIPVVWGQGAALEAFEYFLEDTLLSRVSWSWRWGPLELFEIDGVSFAKVELEDLDVSRTRHIHDGTFDIASHDNRGRIFLREEQGAWRIWEWISFPPEPMHPNDLDLLRLLSGPTAQGSACRGIKLKSNAPETQSTSNARTERFSSPARRRIQ